MGKGQVREGLVGLGLLVGLQGLAGQCGVGRFLGVGCPSEGGDWEANNSLVRAGWRVGKAQLWG